MKKTAVLFVSLTAFLSLACFSPVSAASFQKSANIVGTVLATQGNLVKASEGPTGPSQPQPTKPRPSPKQ